MMPDCSATQTSEIRGWRLWRLRFVQAVAMYKGREPKSGDEEELVANLFDALCWVVMLTENKERFVAAEGIELMLLVIKNKKYARLAALKTLDFALTRCVRPPVAPPRVTPHPLRTVAHRRCPPLRQLGSSAPRRSSIQCPRHAVGLGAYS
jgi:hypothetical protein